MTEYIAYRPQINLAQIHAFDQRLSQCHGSWTVTHSFVHAGDPRVLRLRWIVPGSLWCDVPGYLEFLDRHQHRTLLRCFVSQTQKRTWRFNELKELVSPDLSSNDLTTVLSFCKLQEFLVTREKIWRPGPSIAPIMNLGATFEWIVMENFQRFYQAVARRNVILKELQEQQLGDLDVLAFTDAGLVITVECKSSPSGISREHITRFVRRATLFPADIALLLIDTPNEQHITNRLKQITSCLGIDASKKPLECYTQEGSMVYHIQDNIYVANTRGGIRATLKMVIQVGTSLKRH